MRVPQRTMHASNARKDVFYLDTTVVLFSFPIFFSIRTICINRIISKNKILNNVIAVNAALLILILCTCSNAECIVFVKLQCFWSLISFASSVILCLLKHVISWFLEFQVMKGIINKLPVLSIQFNSLNVRQTRKIDRCLVTFLHSVHVLLALLFLLLHVLMTLLYLIYRLICDMLRVLSLLWLSLIFLFYFFCHSVDCCVCWF